MYSYEQASLFDYNFKENAIDSHHGYLLFQEENTYTKVIYNYKVFTEDGILIAKWASRENCLEMGWVEYLKSSVYHAFLNIVEQDEKKIKKITKRYNPDKYIDNDDLEDGEQEGSSYPYFGYKKDVYTPPKKTTNFLDKLNKSDTLVIHCKDNSTEMLCQIYEGKNWDVLRDGNIDTEELHQLLQTHDKIVCLGHGSSYGLLNIQGGGYTISQTEVPFLKDKKLFFIWCNASTFANRHNLHGFITGNMPSDNWEASAAGFKVSEKYMNDNITFWSKCCADHVDQALRGDFEGAARNIVKDYLAVYGDADKWNDQELGITNYNAERTTAV